MHLPDHWRRYAWIAVSAAIAGLSYWVFFSGSGEGHAHHATHPVGRARVGGAQQTILIHGQSAAMHAIAALLPGVPVSMPAPGERVTL